MSSPAKLSRGYAKQKPRIECRPHCLGSHYATTPPIERELGNPAEAASCKHLELEETSRAKKWRKIQHCVGFFGTTHEDQEDESFLQCLSSALCWQSLTLCQLAKKKETKGSQIHFCKSGNEV